MINSKKFIQLSSFFLAVVLFSVSNLSWSADCTGYHSSSPISTSSSGDYLLNISGDCIDISGLALSAMSTNYDNTSLTNNGIIISNISPKQKIMYGSGSAGITLINNGSILLDSPTDGGSYLMSLGSSYDSTYGPTNGTLINNGTLSIINGNQTQAMYVRPSDSGTENIINSATGIIDMNNTLGSSSTAFWIDASINSIKNQGRVTGSNSGLSIGIGVFGDINTIENSGTISMTGSTPSWIEPIGAAAIYNVGFTINSIYNTGTLSVDGSGAGGSPWKNNAVIYNDGDVGAGIGTINNIINSGYISAYGSNNNGIYNYGNI